MFQSFGYIDNVTKLGDYCRACLTDNTERTHPPEVANDAWEIYKSLCLTDELVEIFNEIEVFQQLAQLGYRLREEPSLIRWTYNAKNRGAADHYHHDGHFGKGGQVSLMLLLEQNIGMTHMRIIPDSRYSFGRKFYDLLWPYPFRGRGRLFRLNDWLIECFNQKVKLMGPRDRLYFFNAGDNLHKAYPVFNTTRTIFHLNFTLFESNLNFENLKNVKISALEPHWKKLLGV